MAQDSKIEWTHHTLFPKAFPSLRPAGVPDAIGLEVLQFVAGVAKRYSIGDIEPKLRVISKWFYVVCPQIPTFVTSAFLAGVTVSLKDRVSPCFIFGFTPIVFCTLCCSMFIVVMVGTSRSALAGNCANAILRFFGVRLAKSVFIAFTRNTHLFPRFFGHLFALHWRNKSKTSNNPSRFQFFTFCHP
jgi:hypothetical protein